MKHRKTLRNGLLYYILAALLLLSVPLLALGACGGSGDTDDDGARQTSGTTGATSNGTNTTEDNSGELEDDEPDDVFAAPATVAYPSEIREQVDAFNDFASQLSLDDVASAAALLTKYRSLAFDGPVNDALFFSYEEYMQFVCEGLNYEYEEEPPDDETINDALENGFLYIADDAYSAYFILRPDFLKYTFAETVSAKVQAFLNLISKHYDYHYGNDFIQNDTLMVTLDQLAEMIVDWENYIWVYPDVTNRSDIEVNLDFYLKIYIGSIQIENSGFYSLAGTDENGEALYKLMDEPRQSYVKFVENYQDSAACPLIAELYQIYSDNNFLYSIKVEDFFRAYGLAYDI